MRALCEACGHVQPPDWKPGDLCGYCGAVARRERRCHWCVQLTPDGKYCRHCGAGLVPDARYGAARWLKHLGADQFVIPDRLAAMDPEQAEHFGRLYQRHASAAERHVDDLAFAEGFARQRGWARALEAELLPRLPLPDAELAALALPPPRGTTAAERLLDIRDTTPFPATRVLAALARLRQQQADAAPSGPALMPDLALAEQALRGPDPALRAEAALALSHWSWVMEPFGLRNESAVVDALHAATAAFPVAATLHLALIAARRQGQGQPVPAAAAGAEDPDVAFAAALARHDPNPLLAALRVPARRFAAALTLVRMNVDFALAPLLPGFPPEEQYQLLTLLASQRRARPDLRAFLAAAGQPAAPGPGSDCRDAIRQLLLLDLAPGDARHMLRERARRVINGQLAPDWYFIRELLDAPALPPGEEVALCYDLVALDLFDPRELPALRRFIAADALPLHFLPDTLRTAPENSLAGLDDVARHQLNAHPGPPAWALHAFLRGVLWDEAAPLVPRERARWMLEHWTDGDYQEDSRPRLAFTAAAATPYFGSFAAYVEHFVFGLEHLAVLLPLQMDGNFLRPLETAAQPADPAALLAAFAALPPELVGRLRRALVALVRDYDRWSLPQRWAIQLLGRLWAHAPWRAGIRAELASLQGGDFDYLIEQALAE